MLPKSVYAGLVGHDRTGPTQGWAPVAGDVVLYSSPAEQTGHWAVGDEPAVEYWTGPLTPPVAQAAGVVTV